MKKQFQYGLAAVAWLAVAAPAWSGNFVAHLDQKDSPPTVATNSQGQAVIKERDGELSYKILVAGLQNTVAAHIHCAPVGVAGQVGVTLFLSAPIDVNGILAQGTIDGPDSPNGCGWVDNFDLLDAIAAGNAYVNVHTIQNLGGEIRGQLE